MNDLHLKYCTESYDEKGLLKTFKINCPDTFNFAYDIVDEVAKENPNKRALVWCNVQGDEKIFSFSQLKELSDKAANLFLSKGIKKGDKVILIMKRHYQFWYAILALHKIGAVVIPATILLTTKDLVYRIESSGASAIVCTAQGDVSSYVDEAQEKVSSLNVKFTVNGKKDGWFDFDEEIEKATSDFTRIETKSTDPMLLYFTSGTTGYPKMVMHNYSYPLAHTFTAKHWQNVVEDGLHFTISETGWAKSVWGKLYGQWIMGTGVFIYDFDKFVPTDVLKMMEKYKINTFCAPPTMYRFLIKDGMENYDLSSLSYATIAGEALSPEVFNNFKDITGLKLMEGFGQTETVVQVCNITGMTPKPGSMGKPSPLYDVLIVDENNNSAAPGVVGEIVIKTGDSKPSGMFQGYYRNEDRTKEVWADGLYHTGDTAWTDEDGYFWYVGRTDDLIKSSGYRIGPFEIESVLLEHPAVLECAVTGVPDEIRGQIVKATIVLAKDFTASEELKDDIKLHVKNLTAPYKYPRIIDFVTELPKTISGKIRRVEIREKE